MYAAVSLPAPVKLFIRIVGFAPLTVSNSVGFAVPIPTLPAELMRTFSPGLPFRVVHKAKKESSFGPELKSASLPTLIKAEVVPACLNLMFVN